jgi:hypothetical protein
MSLREAAEALLHAVEDSGHKADVVAACEALREALAEAEKAEPVAWQERTYSEEDKAWSNWYHIDNESLLIRQRYLRSWVELRPLYPHPAAALPESAKAESAELSDEQCDDAILRLGLSYLSRASEINRSVLHRLCRDAVAAARGKP